MFSIPSFPPGCCIFIVPDPNYVPFDKQIDELVFEGGRGAKAIQEKTFDVGAVESGGEDRRVALYGREYLRTST